MFDNFAWNLSIFWVFNSFFKNPWVKMLVSKNLGTSSLARCWTNFPSLKNTKMIMILKSWKYMGYYGKCAMFRKENPVLLLFGNFHKITGNIETCQNNGKSFNIWIIPAIFHRGISRNMTENEKLNKSVKIWKLFWRKIKCPSRISGGALARG